MEDKKDEKEEGENLWLLPQVDRWTDSDQIKQKTRF